MRQIPVVVRDEYCVQFDRLYLAGWRRVPELSDQTLVRRCQQGDQSAYRQLVERYQRKVFALCLGMVRDREEAMDLTQEVFVKIYRHIQKFHNDSSFSTWVHRIVSNLCIDYQRHQSRLPQEVEFDDKMDHSETEQSEYPMIMLSTNEAPDLAVGRKELGEQISKALGTLSDIHREVLLLRELEGLSYADMAEILHVRRGTVMSRLHNARHNMKDALQDYVSEQKK